jgi:TolA-binding protein
MKIKSLLTICTFFLSIALIQSQSGTAQLGKIIYLEGQAQLVVGTTVTPVKINSILYAGQTLKTAAKSVVEIHWTNGAKTTVEPNSVYPVQELYSQSNGQTLAQSENVFAGFKKIFKQAGESKRVEVGGIRRSKAIADTVQNPDKVYWKEDKEMTFEEASTYYEKGDYVKSAWAFKTFLDQKPMDEMAKYAMFALGHSYLKINNQTRAKELFEQFIIQFSNDDLKVQAESVLAKFVASN